jgi:hypothetical protein
MTQSTATAQHEAPPADTGRSPSEAGDQSVTERVDRLSLEQALIDVEVANARSIDLTARLTEAHAEIAALRQPAQQLPAPTSGAPAMSSLRSLVAGPVKAVARRILPLEVRIRIRQLLG